MTKDIYQPKYTNVNSAWGDPAELYFHDFIELVSLCPDWNLDADLFELRYDGNVYYDNVMVGERIQND